MEKVITLGRIFSPLQWWFSVFNISSMPPSRLDSGRLGFTTSALDVFYRHRSCRRGCEHRHLRYSTSGFWHSTSYVWSFRGDTRAILDSGTPVLGIFCRCCLHRRSCKYRHQKTGIFGSDSVGNHVFPLGTTSVLPQSSCRSTQWRRVD
jgi:hypothetical protein